MTIPPLLAGAITRFTTTVKNGKYVQARCKTKNEKWQATTIYTNHAEDDRRLRLDLQAEVVRG